MKLEKIKKWFKNLFNKIKKYMKINKLFSIYVLISLIITFLLRLLTIKEIINYEPLITDLGLIIIIGSFSFLLKNEKKQYIFLQILLIIFTIICVINDIYYSFYSSFASITELSSLGQAKTVANSFFERLSLSQFIYLIAPFSFYFYFKKKNKKKIILFDKDNYKKNFKKTIISGFIFILLSLITAEGQDFSRLYKQWNRTYIVARFGIVTYQISDLISSTTSKLTTVFGFENALIKMNEYYNSNNSNSKPNKYTGIFDGYNIVFVHMESIQNFLIDLEFNGQKVLPTINQLISEGLYFSNFYPQISTGTSSDTEFSLLTSLLPTRIGIVFTKYYNRDYITIPKLLNKKGYYTFSMHGNDFTMWNRNNAHPSLGYKNFYFKDKYRITDTNTFNLGIKDDDFFKQSIPYLEKIEKENQNYMGTIITLSNHSPYIYLDDYHKFDLSKKYTFYNHTNNKYETKNIDYLTGTTIGNYIISSHSADLDLGTFINDIYESECFNNTIFVFYGDHDARLSKDQFNYYYNYDPIKQDLLNKNAPNYYDYNDYEHYLNKKTPLIIWSKNEQIRNLIKGEITYPMGMIDVMPTIGNMIGIKNNYALGNDIFTIKSDNIVPFPDGDYITNTYYYSSSKDASYIFSKNTIINDDTLKKGIKYTEEKIEISNDIIIHDLIKQREIYKKKGLL